MGAVEGERDEGEEGRQAQTFAHHELRFDDNGTLLESSPAFSTLPAYACAALRHRAIRSYAQPIHVAEFVWTVLSCRAFRAHQLSAVVEWQAGDESLLDVAIRVGSLSARLKYGLTTRLPVHVQCADKAMEQRLLNENLSAIFNSGV